MKYRLFETDKNNNKYVFVEGTYLECFMQQKLIKKGEIEVIEKVEEHYEDQWQRNTLTAIERDKKK